MGPRVNVYRTRSPHRHIRRTAREEVASLVVRVHGEVFLVLNLVVDFVLLVVAGRLSGLRPSYFRCAVAGLLGGGYALWVLIHPAAPGAGAISRMAGAFALILLAYFPASPLRLVAAGLALLFGAALLGGVVLALALLNQVSQPGVDPGRLLPYPIPWGWLVWALVAGAFGFGLVGVYRRRRSMAAWCLRAEIEVEGKTLKVMGLVDTGNRLTDPFSGAPVVVVELEAVEHLLPVEIARLCHDPDAAAVTAEMSALEDEEGWAKRFRVIPFTTVGKVSGIMVGFRPDRIKVFRDGQGSPVVNERTVVCLYNRTLSPAGAYQALLPPELAGDEGEVA